MDDNMKFPNSIEELVIVCSGRYKKFKNIQFQNSLKTFKIYFADEFTPDHLPNSIQTLTISNGYHSNKTKFNCNNKFPDKLEKLEIKRCNNFKFDQILQDSIISLSISENNHFKGENLPKLLKKLIVSECSNFIGNDIKYISCENLEYLKIDYCKNFINFKTNSKKLKKLEIYECSKCDGKYLQEIQTIEFFSISLCDNFNEKFTPRSVTHFEIINCIGFTGNYLNELRKIQILKIESCRNYMGKNFPSSLNHVEIMCCKNFQNIILKNELNIQKFEILESQNFQNIIIENQHNNKKINHLKIERCRNFIGGGQFFENEGFTKFLTIRGCKNFDKSKLSNSIKLSIS